MLSDKSSSKSSSKEQGSDHSHSKSSKHHKHKNSRHRRHSHGKLAPSSQSGDPPQIPKHTHLTPHHSQESGWVNDRGTGEQLYRLDEGSQIWRTGGGSVIYWEVHKLTYKDLSEAIWNWAERGLEQTQKLYLASLRPPHGGHRSGLMDFFCSHRQKLVHDHVQRIYSEHILFKSDLYLILRTWTELKHYLQQLNEKEAPQESSQTLKKIENRLTFHLMVALREYGGLPLDPKHPDKPSWPGTRDKNLDMARLEPEALATTANSVSASSLSEKSSSQNHDPDSEALCCHCHQILEHKDAGQTSRQNPQLSASASKQEPSGHSQALSSSSRQVDTHRSLSESRKVSKHRGKSKGRKERESKTEDSKGKHPSVPTQTTGNKNEKAHRSSYSEGKNNGDSDDSSLISFDSTQFSNAFGMIFHLR